MHTHLAAFIPQPVGDSVALHGLEALEVKEALTVLGARRVTIYHSLWYVCVCTCICVCVYVCVCACCTRGHNLSQPVVRV